MSFARGFIKGFIGQSLDKKAAADKLLGDLNTKVADRYLTDTFSTVNGVGRVRLGGERELSLRIWLAS